jgi:hypothetical protein
MEITHLANRRSIAACGVLFVCAVLAVTGCQNGTSVPADAVVRAFNADVCSTEPAISFASVTTDAIFLSSVQYGAPTAYIGVPPSSTVPIYAETNSGTISTIHAALDSNDDYTDAVIGECGATGALAPQLIQIRDNIPTNLSSTNTAVRLVNLAPSTNSANQSYDLYNGTVAVAGLTNVTYGTQSSYVTFPDAAGTPFVFSIHIHTTGAAAPVSNAMASTASAPALNSLPLTAGQPYTIFLFGTPDATPSGAPLTAYVVNDVP